MMNSDTSAARSNEFDSQDLRARVALRRAALAIGSRVAGVLLGASAVAFVLAVAFHATTIPAAVAIAAWSWHHPLAFLGLVAIRVFLNAILSWAAAPLVWIAYPLLERRKRAGWLLLCASQVLLFVTGAVVGQTGFCAIASVNIWRAVEGWRSWGAPNPEIARLQTELASARAEIADLQARLTGRVLQESA